MEKSKILSIVFPTEFVIRNEETLVLIRHSNGQPLRICKIDEVTQNFIELLDEVRMSVAQSAADKSVE